MYIKYQLVLPNNHRSKDSERAIQTFKNHFIAGLCIVDNDFHFQLWDRLLQQATINLNSQTTKNSSPNFSLHPHIWKIKLQPHTVSPTREKILIHNRTNNRALWAPHGEDGWYIGPAMEIWRCHSSYIPKTRAKRISNTVDYFPRQFNVPKI